MSQRILLVVADEELAGEAAAIVHESGELELVDRVGDEDAAKDAVQRGDVDVVVLHEGLGESVWADLAREIGSRLPQVGLVLLAREQTPELLRQALRSGVRDVVELPLSLEGLEAGVRAAADWTDAVRERVAGSANGELLTGGGGTVIAVAGAKGGTGATTLALQLALTAQGQDEERRVALVDLDLQTGDVRAMLNLQAQRSLIDLVGVADELTVRHLEEALYVHRSGLRVLLGAEVGEAAEEVDADAVRRILDAVRSRHELVVVDVGSWVTEGGAVAAEIATAAVVVTTPDVVGLQGAKRLLGMWQRLHVREPPEVTVVLNRVSRNTEIQPDLVSRVLPDAGIAETTIPAAFWSLEPAVNSGDPERVEDRKLIDSYERLADELELFGEPEREEDAEVGVTRRRLGLESGQVSVETMGLIGLIGLVALLVWQIVLIGYTYTLSGHASREGSRALAVDDPVEPAVKEDLPSAWRRDDALEVDVREEDDPGVTVRLRVPIVVPGWDSPVNISSTSGTLLEDEPLPDSQSSTRASPEAGT